jgi:hypothetical protein
MIKSLSSLYSFLHLTQNEVDSILKNIDISYKPKKALRINGKEMRLI